MSKQIGYRIPVNQKRCKFGKHYQEYLGERWMGSCPMFECIYDGDKIIPEDFTCEEDSDCVAYEPEETIICPKHDIEYFKDDGQCELCHPECEEF